MARVKYFLAGSFIAMTIFSSSLWAAERDLVVIPLKYSVPEQILPAVKAILPNAATVTSYDNQLILQVTPQEKQSVEDLLNQIDSAPRQLLISVRTPGNNRSNQQEISAQGSFANGRVQIGSSQEKGRVVIRNNSSSSTGKGNQGVRATEGMPAYIAVGQSQPVTTVIRDSSGNRQVTTEYQSADQGFYVTARVVGDQVQLSIRQTNDRFKNDANSHSSVKTQRISTSVVGRLGEWITLGGVTKNASEQGQGIVRYEVHSQHQTSGVELRVELLSNP